MGAVFPMVVVGVTVTTTVVLLLLAIAAPSNRSAVLFDYDGHPRTLQLRAPDTGWFADRVERLLGEWADESRELVVELREDHGTVRTMLSSGESAVHLELAGAAGLSLSS